MNHLIQKNIGLERALKEADFMEKTATNHSLLFLTRPRKNHWIRQEQAEERRRFGQLSTPPH
jgi:hypothetical protein